MARICTVGVVVAVMTLVSSPVLAQDGTRMPVPHHQTVSANPFGLMFGWFNVDFERKINEGSTWGVSSSFLSLNGDADYVNVQAAYRFYPQGAALSGFYLGGKGGLHSVGVDDDASGRFFGLGFELGYNWLLGAKRNVSIGMGAGATRLFGGALDGASLTIPTVRLVNVGIAF